MEGTMGQPWQSLKKFFDDLKIRNKLILSYLFIALTPLILLTMSTFEITEEILVNRMTNNLEAIANRQAIQIRSFLREKQLDVKTVARSPYVSDILEIIINNYEKFGLESLEYKIAIASLEKFLKYYLQEANYDDLFLIAKNGEAIFSVKKGEDLGSNYFTGVYRNTELAKVFDRATTLIETQVSDFAYYPATNEPAIFIAAPILKDSEVIGGLVLQLNNAEVYEVVNNHIGLQSTGETLIIGQVDDYITYLTPTRFDPYAPFRRHISLNSSEGEFFRSVIHGQNRKGIIKDYRGKETLAVGKYFLPELGWGMIVKIDTDELFAPISFLKWLAILFSLLTAAFVLLTTYKVAETIAYPIIYMMQKAQIISLGNLSETIDIEAKNEMGQLAHAFNDMTSKLRNIISHLDDLVKERTFELERAKDRLVIQEKLASLGALTAGIAHEIKNPLNFVTNLSLLSLHALEDLQSTMINQRIILPEEKDQFLTIEQNIRSTFEQGKKADNIVQRMLAHSRLGKGLVSDTNINQLVNDYLDLTAHSAIPREFPVTIEKRLDPNLAIIQAIAEDIGRVLLNIFNNAFYAMGKKREQDQDYRPLLIVETKNLENKIEIKIRDNGIGIPEDVAKHIFTPFFTTKPPGEGTGLGLSLSYNIVVQEHEGELEFKSEQGKFTEFIIRLLKDFQAK